MIDPKSILANLKAQCIKEQPLWEDEIKVATTVQEVTEVLESLLYDDEIVDLLTRFLENLISGVNDA